MWKLVAIAVVFYFIGAYYGTFAKTAVSTVTGVVGA